MPDQPHETTPATLSPDVQAFLIDQGLDGASYVPHWPLQEARRGMCWRNVGDVVGSLGGSISCGWAIWEFPQLYICAHLHAVWASPEGLLLDVTPHPNGEEIILFAPDRTVGQDFGLLQNRDYQNTRIYRFLPGLKEAAEFSASRSAVTRNPVRPAYRPSGWAKGLGGRIAADLPGTGGDLK